MEHRIGGLEKEDITGNVSYDALNHEHMVRLRARRIEGIASDIPGVNIAAERVSHAIVTSLFREDIAEVRRKLEEFNESELEGTPFFVPNF